MLNVHRVRLLVELQDRGTIRAVDGESDDPALTCSLVRAGPCGALVPQAFIDTAPDEPLAA